jgi:hypothetical protein
VNEFIYHLYTRLRTTSNYSATTNLHNSQITKESAKPFPACSVFTSRSLATAFKSGDSSASRAHVLSSQPSLHNSLKRLSCPNCLQDNSSERTTQKHPVSNSTSIVARRFIAAGTCLTVYRYLETYLVYSPISRSSHSNGTTRYNMNK